MATILKKAGKNCYQKVDLIETMDKITVYKKSYVYKPSVARDSKHVIIIQGK
jgi:hypothetical protein